jgi:hypothetical protein
MSFRWGRLVIGGIALLGAVAVGWWLWLRYERSQEEKRVRDAVAEVDRVDPLWRLEEIEAHRIQLPDERNSAVQVLKVKAMLPSPWPSRNPRSRELSDDGSRRTPVTPNSLPLLDRVTGLPAEVAMDAPLAGELRAELQSVAPALEAARLLAELPDGRYPVQWSPDWIGTRLPCQDARLVAVLLRLQVSLFMDEGRVEDALMATKALVNCARSIGDEPSDLSQLVRISVTSVALSAVERILGQGEPPSAALETLQAVLEREAREPILLYMARGERAGQYHLYKGMMDGDVRLSSVAPQAGTLTGPVEDWQAAALARRAIPKMLRYLTDLVEAAKLPAEQQRARLDAITPKLYEQNDPKAAEDVLLGLLMPSVTNVAMPHLRQQALLRSALAALAAERFRRDNGHWPAVLADLTPRYLEQAPVDPFDAQPLRLRALPDGIVVYSVGYDGQDDGGKIDSKKMTQPGFDIGIRLWDVSQRRQRPELLTALPVESLDNEPDQRGGRFRSGALAAD